MAVYILVKSSKNSNFSIAFYLKLKTMKRFLFVGCMLLGLGQVSYAQVDDIYSNGNDQKQGTQQSAAGYSNNGNSRQDNYNAQQSGGDVYQSYDNPDDYIDNDEGVTYSSRINRFNYSFYNMGYYSTFYNPFWYDRYWVDPYYSWNPWRPHFGVSFGFGPYWSSAWGYNCWYGYGAWGSYWNYPMYYGGYYGGGYWNRYYNTGEYAGTRGGVGYGPRQVVGYSGVRGSGSGLRTAPGTVRPSAFNNSAYLSGGGRNQAMQSTGRTSQQVQNTDRSNVRQRSGFARLFGGGNGGNNVFRGQGRSQGYTNGGGTRSYSAPSGGGRSFGGGGATRSIGGGGGGTRSSGGGGGSRSSGGGGSRSSGGGHSGGRR